MADRELLPGSQRGRGDLYDFLPFEDGRLGPVIGDVTDKGMPAAVVMAGVRSAGNGLAGGGPGAGQRSALRRYSRKDVCHLLLRDP